jgi:hypothetical protein
VSAVSNHGYEGMRGLAGMTEGHSGLCSQVIKKTGQTHPSSTVVLGILVIVLIIRFDFLSFISCEIVEEMEESR